LHRNGLALEVPQELPRFAFGGKISLVFCAKRIARESIRVRKDGIIGPRATGLQREPKEAFGFRDVSTIDSTGRGGPGFGLFALEPTPEWQEPAAQEESEPDVKKPGPGVGLCPAKGCIEVDKPRCLKTVQRKSPSIYRLLLLTKHITSTHAARAGPEEFGYPEIPACTLRPDQSLDCTSNELYSSGR